MSKSPIVAVSYWSGEGPDAHVIREHGVRVVLHYSPEGHPTMYVDRPSRRTPTEEDKYADDLMMLWNRAALATVRKGTDKRVEVLGAALRKVETAHFDQWCALCLGGDAPALHKDDCPVGIALAEPTGDAP